MKTTSQNIRLQIDRSKKKQSHDEMHQHQWVSIKNRIDSVLLGMTSLKTDEVRKACSDIDTLDHESRMQHIASIWGPLYLERVMPLLEQLKILESQPD